MSYKTGFYEGRLGIGLGSTMGMGDGNPRYPLDINGDIRLTGSIVNGDGQVLSLVPAESLWTIGNNNLSYAGGNVGIGNSSPEYLLDLADSTYANGGGYPPAEFIRFGTANISPNSSGGLIWKTTYGGSYTKISAKIEAICEADYFRQGLAFFTGNETYTTDATERMRIDMDGNVGIGTTSPDELLHVNVNTSNTAEIYPLIISNDYTFGFNTGNDIGCGIGFKSHWKGDGIDSPTVMTAIESHKESSANFGDSYLSFKTRRESNRSLGGVGVLAERMRIDSVGNVGIGTTSPVSALTIGGTTTTLSDTIITLASDGGSAYKQGIKMIHHGGAPNGGTDATQYGWYMFGSDVTDKLHIGSYNGSSTESDHLVITRSSGNVGIGTTSPHSKLHVNGNITLDACRTGSSYPTGSVGGGISFREGAAYAPDSSTGAYNCSILTYAHDQSTDGLSINGYDGVSFCTGSSTRNEQMRINSSGNVGIGYTDPKGLLHIYGNTHSSYSYSGLLRLASSSSNGSGSGNWALINFPDSNTASSANENYYMIGRGHQYTDNCLTLHVPTDGSIDMCSTGAVRMMKIQGDGNVGIGTTSPKYPLDVDKSSTSSDLTYWNRGSDDGAGFAEWNSSYLSGNQYGQAEIADLDSGTHSTFGINAKSIAAHFKNNIYVSDGAVLVSSDRRIKTNIVDVNDNLALEMVRNIPCRYYNYKDKLSRGTNATIGFIAQEVKEIYPRAVVERTQFIPNVMRNLMDLSWNGATLYTDLSDCSGVKYRFYVSNDVSGNNEIKKEVIGNSDNSFTFDTSYNNVFCYGKEVNDFHTLDKNKLFALNFSATQEIDRKQQADKARITQLETELAAIKQHLGI